MARTQWEGGLRLEPDGEALGFSITEQTDKVRHEPTEAEQTALRRHEEAKQRAARQGKWFSDWDRPKIPEWDWIPNGRLALHLDMGSYRADRIRQKFGDGKTQRLEGLIEPMIASLAAYAAAEKEGRARRELERIEAAEREKRRQEVQRRLDLDNKQYEFVQAQGKRLNRALEIERIIEAIAAQGEADGAVAAFIAWGRQLAANIRANLSFAVLAEKLEHHNLMNDEAHIGSWVDVDKLRHWSLRRCGSLQ